MRLLIIVTHRQLAAPLMCAGTTGLAIEAW